MNEERKYKAQNKPHKSKMRQLKIMKHTDTKANQDLSLCNKMKINRDFLLMKCLKLEGMKKKVLSQTKLKMRILLLC